MHAQPAKGYFSLIQYCPDLGRLEAANVGVLLFCPERSFLKALTTRSNARIKRFFGAAGHDWERIHSFKQGFVERIEREGRDVATLDDLQRFIAQRANLIQLTPPRPMKVLDPEADLRELFDEYLGVGVAKPKSTSKSLRQLLGKKLDAAGLQSKIRRDLRVAVPVLGREIDVPFGFQNGRFNLITPVRFTAAHSTQAVTASACTLAVEGRSLFEHSDSKLGALQLVVVGKFRPNDRESVQLVRRIFDDNQVKLYRTSELPQLIEAIRQTGKDVVLSNEN
jgi:hypothetical protein